MSALRVGIMLPSRETAMTGRHDARGLVEFAKSAEEAESDAVGIPFAGRGARLDETVTLWRQTWDGQGVRRCASGGAVRRPTGVVGRWRHDEGHDKSSENGADRRSHEWSPYRVPHSPMCSRAQHDCARAGLNTVKAGARAAEGM
jgi:hypothetical protein